MMKICTKCKLQKSLSDFNFKIISKNQLSSHCRQCSREYVRGHYKNNRDYYLRKARRRNLRIRDEVQNYIRSFLSTHPCIDCNESDILVLEFDHLRDKIHSISEMIGGYYGLSVIKLEMEKCEVRCANCHRRRTAKQFGWFRDKLPL